MNRAFGAECMKFDPREIGVSNVVPRTNKQQQVQKQIPTG
jgi:hypothetical protein